MTTATATTTKASALRWWSAWNWLMPTSSPQQPSTTTAATPITAATPATSATPAGPPPSLSFRVLVDAPHEPAHWIALLPLVATLLFTALTFYACLPEPVTLVPFAPPSALSPPHWHHHHQLAGSSAFPSPSLITLLLSSSSSSSYSPTPITNAVSTPAPFWPFLGRKSALVALHTALRTYHYAVITGAPGSGKTRLVNEYVRRITTASRDEYMTLLSASDHRASGDAASASGVPGSSSPVATSHRRRQADAASASASSSSSSSSSSSWFGSLVGASAMPHRVPYTAILHLSASSVAVLHSEIESLLDALGVSVPLGLSEFDSESIDHRLAIVFRSWLAQHERALVIFDSVAVDKRTLDAYTHPHVHVIVVLAQHSSSSTTATSTTIAHTFGSVAPPSIVTVPALHRSYAARLLAIVAGIPLAHDNASAIASSPVQALSDTLDSHTLTVVSVGILLKRTRNDDDAMRQLSSALVEHVPSASTTHAIAALPGYGTVAHRILAHELVDMVLASFTDATRPSARLLVHTLAVLSSPASFRTADTPRVPATSDQPTSSPPFTASSPLSAPIISIALPTLRLVADQLNVSATLVQPLLDACVHMGLLTVQRLQQRDDWWWLARLVTTPSTAAPASRTKLTASRLLVLAFVSDDAASVSTSAASVSSPAPTVVHLAHAALTAISARSAPALVVASTLSSIAPYRRHFVPPSALQPAQRSTSDDAADSRSSSDNPFRGSAAARALALQYELSPLVPWPHEAFPRHHALSSAVPITTLFPATSTRATITSLGRVERLLSPSSEVADAADVLSSSSSSSSLSSSSHTLTPPDIVREWYAMFAHCLPLLDLIGVPRARLVVDTKAGALRPDAPPVVRIAHRAAVDAFVTTSALSTSELEALYSNFLVAGLTLADLERKPAAARPLFEQAYALGSSLANASSVASAQSDSTTVDKHRVRLIVPLILIAYCHIADNHVYTARALLDQAQVFINGSLADASDTLQWLQADVESARAYLALASNQLDRARSSIEHAHALRFPCASDSVTLSGTTSSKATCEDTRRARDASANTIVGHVESQFAVWKTLRDGFVMTDALERSAARSTRHDAALDIYDWLQRLCDRHGFGQSHVASAVRLARAHVTTSAGGQQALTAAVRLYEDAEAHYRTVADATAHEHPVSLAWLHSGDSDLRAALHLYYVGVLRVASMSYNESNTWDEMAESVQRMMRAGGGALLPELVRLYAWIGEAFYVYSDPLSAVYAWKNALEMVRRSFASEDHEVVRAWSMRVAQTYQAVERRREAIRRQEQEQRRLRREAEERERERAAREREAREREEARERQQSL